MSVMPAGRSSLKPGASGLILSCFVVDNYKRLLPICQANNCNLGKIVVGGCFQEMNMATSIKTIDILSKYAKI
jgi:hypothetical protein